MLPYEREMPVPVLKRVHGNKRLRSGITGEWAGPETITQSDDARREEQPTPLWITESDHVLGRVIYLQKLILKWQIWRCKFVRDLSRTPTKRNPLVWGGNHSNSKLRQNERFSVKNCRENGNHHYNLYCRRSQQITTTRRVLFKMSWR